MYDAKKSRALPESLEKPELAIKKYYLFEKLNLEFPDINIYV